MIYAFWIAGQVQLISRSSLFKEYIIDPGKALYARCVVFKWRSSPVENVRMCSSVDGVRWSEVFADEKACFKKASVFFFKFLPLRFLKLKVPGSARLLEAKFLEGYPSIYFTAPPIVERVGTNWAEVKFELSHPCSISVAYGKNPEALESENMLVVTDVSQNHVVKLQGLEAGQRYYLRAVARNIYGDETSRSQTVEFYTKGRLIPYIENVKIFVGTTWAVFLVRTSVSTVREVIITVKKGRKVFKNDLSSKEAAVIVDGLDWGREYSWTLVCCSEQGDKQCSKKGRFTTRNLNVAFLKKVEGTFVYDESGKKDLKVLQRIVDGSLSFKRGMARSGDPSRAAQWAGVKLGRVFRVSRVIVYWDALCFPEKFLLQAFYKGKKTGSVTLAHLDKIPTVRNDYGSPMKVVEAKLCRSADYIKIIVPKGTPYYKKFEGYNFLQIYEIEVIPERR